MLFFLIQMYLLVSLYAPTAFIITLRYSLEWVQESKSQQRDGTKKTRI